MRKKNWSQQIILFLLCFSLILGMDVNVSAAAVKLNKTTLNLYANQTYQLLVSGTKSKIKWSVSNKKVASVSATGKIKAQTAGSCYVYAKVNKKTLKCKLTVKKANEVSKLYEKFLKGKYATVDGSLGKQRIKMNYFTLLDIDKNGVKELLVEQELYDTMYHVFLISGGKVKYAGTARKGGGASAIYNPTQKGLAAFYSGTGAAGDGFLKIKKGKLVETIQVYAMFNQKITYELNGKSCSEKTYASYYNKYFKTSKLKTTKFVEVNEGNMKKKLK